MKKTVLAAVLLFLSACSAQPQPVADHTASAEPEPSAEPAAVITALPEKTVPESALSEDSVLSAENIDNYLFLQNVMYIDLRTFEQVASEGSIAGFTVIPFYGVISDWSFKDNVLFTMSIRNNPEAAYPGDVGTYSPNYEESEDILHEVFPEDKQIVFMSTAGVEAAYMINLLKQYGYDPSLLYNAGTFTNGIGNVTAYRDYPMHRYYTEGTDAYSVTASFSWGELHEIK
ncbi:MAG: hypothetical protein K6D03_12045 [Solobacterium sp.]|nr:hypothetical protein [Solobacterium sp.]